MTKVRIGIRVPTAEGELVRPSGRLEWSPSVRREVDGDAVLPAAFTVSLTAASDDPEIEVAATGPGWAWRVREYLSRGRSGDVFVLIPNTAETLDYETLQQVDPATLDPIGPAPIDVWSAALTEATSAATGTATTAASDATTAARAATTAAVSAESAAERAEAAVQVAIQTVDLAAFLLPGEIMPSDGVLNAQPLLQRALDQAAARTPTTGPRAIRLPPGTFRINTSVRWNTGYHVGFIGAGRANTVILPFDTATFGLMNTAYDSATYLDGLVFADFTIDCSNQAGPLDQVGIKGIALRWMRNGLFSRVRVLNSWATSFGCDFLQDVTFADCTAIGSGRGVLSPESFGAGFGIGVGNFRIESVNFVNCHAVGSKSSGFFYERLIETRDPIQDSRGITLTGCSAIGCYNGLRDMGAHGLLISNSHFLDNANSGICIDGGVISGRHGGKDGLVSNSVLRGNGVGVLIGRAATGGYTVTGCEITNNLGAGISTTTNPTPQMGESWRILNNRIESNGAGGIVLGAPLLGRIEIALNSILANGRGPGIQLAGDIYGARITDNVVQGHIGIGVSLPGATLFAVAPVVRGNDLTENSGGSLINEKVTDDTTGITGNRESTSFATLTNLLLTPTYTLGVAPIANVSNTGAPTLVTGEAGGAFARIPVTANGSATARVARRSQSFAPGVYTIVAEVRAPHDAVLRGIGIGRWDANVTSRSWQVGGIRPTGDWQWIALRIIVPTGGSQIDLNLALDVAKTGMNLDVRKVGLFKGTTAWAWFDGTSPGAAWTGTAHNSQSTLTL